MDDNGPTSVSLMLRYLRTLCVASGHEKRILSNNEHTVSDACNSALVTLSLEHEPAAITRSSAPQALAPMRHLHSCLCPAADSSLSISRASISATSAAVLRYISNTHRWKHHDLQSASAAEERMQQGR